MKFPSPSSAEAVISVTNLSRRFGPKAALDDVSIYVSRGSVLGLVGENGAGKTTLIKHLLGMLRAEAGTVRMFGLDPTADPVGVLSRIGYLSERRDLPGWMRIEEFMRYTQAFYPSWDEDYAEQMREHMAKLGFRTVDEMGVLLTLTVHPDDMGKIIGRDGNTAKALRTLLRVVGMKHNARVNLKINEPAGGKREQEFKSVDEVVDGLN